MPERNPSINRKAARHHRTKMEVPFVTNFNIAEEFDPAWLDSKPDFWVLIYQFKPMRNSGSSADQSKP